MRLLDITVDVGPGARLAHLEVLVKGIRVAADVAREAELRRIRRSAAERMKYPTNTELRTAIERFPAGDERSPRYLAERQLEARERLAQDMERYPPEFWWPYRERRRADDFFNVTMRAAGLERLLDASPSPLVGAAVGLDVLAPALYDALVADEVSRSAPGEIGVRELRYSNPFFKRLFGKGTAEQTVSTTVQVIETVSTLSSTRTVAKAEATVADATAHDRIAESRLDVALKEQELIEKRLRNERLAIDNARAMEALGTERFQREIVEQAVLQGKLDIADAMALLTPADAQALGELGRQPIEFEQSWEPDESAE